MGLNNVGKIKLMMGEIIGIFKIAFQYLVQSYSHYYNEDGTHHALNRDGPDGRVVQLPYHGSEWIELLHK